MNLTEFQTLCEQNNIIHVPLYDNNNKYLGIVTKDFKYDYSNASMYYRNLTDALAMACKAIHEVIGLIHELNNIVTISISKKREERVFEYDDGRGYVTHHAFGKTITKLTQKEYTDTLDKIFETFYTLNNKARYSNDTSYLFNDKSLTRKYLIWLNIISHYRKFNLYYSTGLVD